VNGDGRVDIYCAEGASTVAGSIVKSNDLLMQQSDGTFVDRAQAMGVDDPYGRGRDVTFLNANGDAYPDLFVGNVGGRTDGKPSHNRLFLNDGGAGFHDSGDPDITSTTGAHCAIPRDVNGDGWTDLLVCSAGKKGGPLHLYRNDAGKGFTDVSSPAGLRGVALDAEILDLNRDGRLDILSVDPTGVHIQFATAPPRFGPPRALPVSRAESTLPSPMPRATETSTSMWCAGAPWGTIWATRCFSTPGSGHSRRWRLRRRRAVAAMPSCGWPTAAGRASWS
jgi:hypothetical protein